MSIVARISQSRARMARIFVLGAVVSLTAVVSGCGNTDVEFKGGLFEMAGLTDLNSNKKRSETEVPLRSGIVIPPENAPLPVPGSVPMSTASISGDAAWPVDPEEAKANKNAALKREHAAFCERAREKARITGTDDVEDGPLGSCRQSILKSLTGRDLINDNLNSKKQ